MKVRYGRKRRTKQTFLTAINRHGCCIFTVSWVPNLIGSAASKRYTNMQIINSATLESCDQFENKMYH